MLFLVFALLSAFARPARAIEIDQVMWGFDGRVRPHQFTPVSILVTNSTPEPFDGLLKLRKSMGASPLGAEIVEPLYLSQYSSKWVQLYPYVQQGYERWTLSWGRGRDERMELPQYNIAKASPVLIVPEGNLLRQSARMRQFSESLFPPGVTATDGLEQAVLGHSPRWEEARRQAFFDWLVRGGHVHLVRGADGNYPEFTGELAELNAPFDRFRVGSGLVVRHDRSADDIDREFVAQLTGQSGAADGDNETAQPGDGREAEQPAPEPVVNYPTGNELYHDFAGGMFHTLRSMTRPDHNWPLIYFLSLVYLLTVFPGAFLLGRRRVDYRLVYGMLLGCVAVFSVTFAVVGRRGYGESTSVHSVAIARPLPDGSLDVTGWSNAFVVSGRVYFIEHEGTGRLYSTAQQNESVKGQINNGVDGGFVVDIPPFSSRPFTHRVKLPHKPLECTVVEWKAGEQLEALTLSTMDGFPVPANAEVAWAVYRNRIYKLETAEGVLQAQFSTSRALADYLGQADFDYFTPYMFFNQDDEDATQESRFLKLYKHLVVYQLGIQSREELQEYSLPGDRVRLFLYAPMPPELFIQNDELGGQAGYVLYSIDVFQPDES